MALHDGIHLFLQTGELFEGGFLQFGIALDVLHVTFTHVLDAVLRIVAIHHDDIHSFHVIEIACHQYRERRFACATFLGGEGDK